MIRPAWNACKWRKDSCEQVRENPFERYVCDLYSDGIRPTCGAFDGSSDYVPDGKGGA